MDLREVPDTCLKQLPTQTIVEILESIEMIWGQFSEMRWDACHGWIYLLSIKLHHMFEAIFGDLGPWLTRASCVSSIYREHEKVRP